MSKGLSKICKTAATSDISKCLKIKEENSTVEIVRSSNCIINIDYFVKEDKISLELFKSSVDSKCVTRQLTSNQNNKNEIKMPIGTKTVKENYKKNPLTGGSSKDQEDCNNCVLCKNKVDLDINSGSYNLMQAQPVKDISKFISHTQKENFAVSSFKFSDPKPVLNTGKTYCSIYFDGTRSRKRKKSEKKKVKFNSEFSTSEDTSLLYKNDKIFENSKHNDNKDRKMGKEREQLKRKKTTQDTPTVNKDGNIALLLEEKKHAKFEIVLTPRSDDVSSSSEFKSDNSYQLKKKKLILKSNTLELMPNTELKSNDKRNRIPGLLSGPFDTIVNTTETIAAGDGDIKYSRKHTKPVVLTVSTFVCANIKGINIFSNLQDLKKKIPIPHRHVEDETGIGKISEIQPHFPPIPHRPINEKKESATGERVIETKEILSEVVKIPEMPRRFIGNDTNMTTEDSTINLSNELDSDPSQNETTLNQDRYNINDNQNENFYYNSDVADNSCCSKNTSYDAENITSAGTGTYSLGKPKYNFRNESDSSRVLPGKQQTVKSAEDDLYQKFKICFEGDNNLQVAQFFKFMHYFMARQEIPTNFESTNSNGNDQNLNNFIKVANNIVENITTTSINSEKPAQTKIPRKIWENVETSDRVKPNYKNNVIVNENHATSLKTRNAFVKEKSFTENSHRDKVIINQNKYVGNRKNVTKSSNQQSQNKVKNFTTNSKNTEIKQNVYSPCKKLQNVVKRFTNNKNQENVFKKPMNINVSSARYTQQVKDIFSARELRNGIEKTQQKIDNNNDKKSKHLAQNNNSCKKKNMQFRRAKTFCSETDSGKNNTEQIPKDITLLPFTNKCIEDKSILPLKISVSNVPPENIKEKTKNQHSCLNKNHIPGCIYNSSFLFTKCNTEQSKESSFQKRKEYNMNLRKKFKEKEGHKRGFQKIKEFYLDDYKITQLEKLRDKIQNSICKNNKCKPQLDSTKKLLNRTENKSQINCSKNSRHIDKAHSRTTLSKTKLASGYQLSENSKCTSKFSRTTFTTPSIFSFANQEKPRRNYAEVHLPSFICPDPMWVHSDATNNDSKNGTQNNSATDNSVSTSEPKSSCCRDVDKKEHENGTNTTKNNVATTEKKYSKTSTTANDHSTPSLTKTKAVNRKYSVANNIRNRILFNPNTQKKRYKYEQSLSQTSSKQIRNKSICKPNESSLNLQDKNGTSSVEDWLHSVNIQKKKNSCISCDKNQQRLVNNQHKTKRQRVRSNISRKNSLARRINNKTIPFIKNIAIEKTEETSPPSSNIVHQNIKYLKDNTKDSKCDKVETHIQIEVCSEKSDDTLLNFKTCNNSQVFTDDLCESDNLISNALNENINNESEATSKKLGTKKSSKTFILHKVSSQIGKLFRVKKSKTDLNENTHD